jgi:hypothetical protein
LTQELPGRTVCSCWPCLRMVACSSEKMSRTPSAIIRAISLMRICEAETLARLRHTGVAAAPASTRLGASGTMTKGSRGLKIVKHASLIGTDCVFLTRMSSPRSCSTRASNTTSRAALASTPVLLSWHHLSSGRLRLQNGFMKSANYSNRITILIDLKEAPQNIFHLFFGRPKVISHMIGVIEQIT